MIWPYCNSWIVMFLTAGIFIQLFGLSHVQSPIQNQTTAIQQFNFCRSKLFISHSSVWPRPFKSFPQPFIRSTSSVKKYSAAVHPFNFICSNIFCSLSTSPIHKLSSTNQCNQRFEQFLELFLICSLDLCSSIWTDTVRNVFCMRGHMLCFMSQ